ncbi:MAG: hemolysin family protein [Actinobacteria bacterium]|nr:hemolysin family protein [Actinomycetota bacterium]
MSVPVAALAFVALVAANALFVATEFAFVATGRHRLEERAQAGDRRAHHALAVQRRLSFMLSGAQLGITVTSLLLGVIAEPTLARALIPALERAGLAPGAARGIGVVVALLVATAIAMVFGELAPKNLAIGQPEVVALRLARPTALLLRLAGPIIALFDNLSNRLLLRIGIEPAEELDQAVTADELEVIIAESGRVGSLSASQTGLLQRVLDFRALRASDVLLPRPAVVTVPADATCADLAALASTSGLSRFPVVGDDLDDVRGVVVAKDVLSIPVADRATRPVDVLRTPPLAVPESALLSPLLRDLRQAHSQLALVIDEHGGVTGIVTLEDIVEELVGDIRDEHDRAPAGARTQRDGSYLVPGSWRLDECERDTGLRLPEGDYETLSGLVMALLGRVPEVGDRVETEHATLRVEALRGFAVHSLWITGRRSAPGGDGTRAQAEA